MGAKGTKDTTEALKKLSMSDPKVIKKNFKKLFKLYDDDSSNTIEELESVKFIHDFMSANDLEFEEKTLDIVARVIFEIADKNEDGVLTRDEFLEALLRFDEISARVNEELLYLLTPSGAVTSWLISLQLYMKQNISTPLTKKPFAVPDLAILLQAAAKLNTCEYPVDMMYVIRNRLLRGSDFDSEAPTTLNLPNDHHFQPKCGAEWYWVGCNLNVTNSQGVAGKIGFLSNFEKVRSMGNHAQTLANWSDLQTMMFSTLATVTVDYGETNGLKTIFRRSQNKEWGYFSPEAMNYSVPGQPFNLKVNNDTYSCPTGDVMPLQVIIDDGDNMQVSVLLQPKSGIDVANSYFLQGFPNQYLEGSGVTGDPTPGIYYSWPQLEVTGTITVGGEQYTIQSGSGWVDHQMMMNSLINANNTVEPVPYLQDFAPINGWTWQFYNLSNGDAFTGASFILGAQAGAEIIPYGYYITQNGSRYKGTYFIGYNIFSQDTTVQAPVTETPVELQSQVAIPTVRTYLADHNIPDPSQGIIVGSATAWIPDGSLNNPDWTMATENPATFVSSISGITGEGFLEAIGWEPAENWRDRANVYLKKCEFPY